MGETVVGWFFSASHRDIVRGGELHGHTYEVRVAFDANPPRDALALQAKLRLTLEAAFDHKTLPDDLSRAEQMAEALANLLGDCLWVEVWRPAERLGARWCT
jgi:6-pyruvoyl-tetrahydropterin synthase